MKKYVLAMVMMLAACQFTAAQSVSSIINEFKYKENVEYVNIPPYVMWLGRLFMEGGEEAELAKKVNSVRVLDLDGSPDDVKRQFLSRVIRMSKKEYETLVQVNDESDRMRLFAKGKGDTINELLILCAGEDECTLIQLNCKIKREDVSALVNEQTRKRHERH